jgi:hypothetical protein
MVAGGESGDLPGSGQNRPKPDTPDGRSSTATLVLPVFILYPKGQRRERFFGLELADDASSAVVNSSVSDFIPKGWQKVAGASSAAKTPG